MHMSFRDGVHALVVHPREPTSSDFPAWSPEETLLQAWLDGGQALLVDLRGVTRVHSRFLGFLARLKALLSEQGGRLVLLVDSPDLGRNIDLLGLDRVFTLTGSWAEALHACRLEEGAWLHKVPPCSGTPIHD